MSSFLNYIWNKQKLQPINQQTFLKVEFVTKQQKIHKNMALEKIKKNKQKLTGQQVVIHNTDNQYKVSFRQTYAFVNIISLVVGKLIEAIQGNSEDQFNAGYEFYNEYVETIELMMYGGKVVKFDDSIALMDFEDKIANDPNKTLEVVYIKKGFFSRAKVLAKKAVVSLPSLIAKLISKIVSTIIGWLGLNSASSIFYTLFKSFVGTKTIMQYVTFVITMFFPMLGPILGIAKFM